MTETSDAGSNAVVIKNLTKVCILYVLNYAFRATIGTSLNLYTNGVY